MRLRLTVRARLLLACFLPFALAMVSMLGFVIWNYYRDLVRESELRLRAEVNEAGLRIDLANVTASTVPKTMALAQEAGLFGNRPVSLEFARRILEAFPEFTGAYFGYEPDGDGHDRSAAETDGVPRDAVSREGRFLPYWFRDREDPLRIRLSPLVNTESSYYYRGVKNRQEGKTEEEGVSLPGGISRLYRHSVNGTPGQSFTMVTEPYEYEGKYMVEHVVPLLRDGRFLGIAGVDTALNDIDDTLRRIHRHESGGFFLLSQRGRVIASTVDPSMRARRIEDTPWLPALELAYLDTGKGTFQLAPDPRDGTATYVVSTRLATGDWTLVLAASRAEILAGLSDVVKGAAGVSVVVLASVLGMALLALRAVSRRIEDAAGAAARVAAGDLGSRLDIAGPDEIGDLLRAMDAMRQALADLIGRVKRSSDQLVAVGDEITVAAQHEESLAHEFGALTQQIAASVREISTTGDEMVRNVADVAGAVAATAEVASAGRACLGETEAAMRRMNEGMSSVVERFTAIGEQAKGINRIMNAMTDIAVQTNLLSLNASIEAEKAGKQGAGFAVVAGEIRRLADQSAVAALDVETMVRDMQQVVAGGVQVLESFQEDMRTAGLSNVRRLADHFTTVLERIDHLVPGFGRVYEGMRAQAEGARQINEAMVAWNDEAQGVAESAEHLNSMVVRLHTAVQELQTEIGRFRL
ncbi:MULTISPECIES: methyl-accepting chemotaxis protein [Methylococcus]|uniref:Methyl-accepting chemotaxis protein n=1 Tax=Methylococcus capsulatus TaxID=414 RepID=A0ABZ2F4I5_METCP|nr:MULTISPECIES: methyl-accepting chemotaxis protein [Methylococcus]MDF9391797.1 methyl-accepting chemotaxis protein [Methylococcus capsulatus]